MEKLQVDAMAKEPFLIPSFRPQRMFERNHIALTNCICYRHKFRYDVRLGTIYERLRGEPAKDHIGGQ
jgi:hypothetical protein